MSLSSSAQLKFGSILSYAQMGINVIIGLLYTPFMIRCLGQNEYGLYQTIVSTISLLSVLSLGFNASYIRYYSRYKVDGNQNDISKLNGLFLLVFLAIGFIALTCGLYITWHLDLVFDKGLTPSEYTIARTLMFIQTINLAIMFPMSVFQNIIMAHERFIFLKSIGLINTVFSPLICIPLLLYGYRSITLVTVSFILSMITNCIYVYYVLRRLNNKFLFHNFPKGIFVSLFAYTFFIALNSIVDQINMNMGKLLISRFRGTAETAIYSVGFSLFSYYQLFSTSISGVFTPRIHLIVNSNLENMEKQRNELTSLMIKVGRLQYILLMFILMGFIMVGYSFITSFWVGPEYAASYIIALTLMAASSIALIQNIGIETQRAMNKHQFRAAVYFAMAILNLLLSIYLCQRFGAIGCTIGTAISLVFANGLIMNIFYHKRCNIDIISFWKSILSLSKGLIIPAAFILIILKYYNTTTILGFCLSIIGFSFCYWLSIYFIGMNQYERNLFKSFTSILMRK